MKNRKLVGYSPSADGLFRRQVLFPVFGKPNVHSVKILVRTSAGQLLRSENARVIRVGVVL